MSKLKLKHLKDCLCAWALSNAVMGIWDMLRRGFTETGLNYISV